MGAPRDIEVGRDSEGPMQIGGTHHKIKKSALSRTSAGMPHLGFNDESAKHPSPPQIGNLLGGVIKIRNKNSFEAQTPLKKQNLTKHTVFFGVVVAGEVGRNHEDRGPLHPEDGGDPIGPLHPDELVSPAGLPVSDGQMAFETQNRPPRGAPFLGKFRPLKRTNVPFLSQEP